MGCDFIVESIWIEKGKKPNWKAGRARIKELVAKIKETGECPTDLDHLDENEVLPRLTQCLKDVKLGWENKHRDMACLEFPPWIVLLTGGGSWGDAPNELFNEMNDLMNSGVLEACGFNPYMPNYKKLLETTLDSVPKMLPALLGVDEVLDEMIEKRLKT